MKITNKTTVKEVSVFMGVWNFWDELEGAFTKVDVPQMTYGNRIDLSEMKTIHDILFMPQLIFFSRVDAVFNMPFFEVYNFGMSVLKELERMNVRDEQTFKYNPSREEVAAGYHKRVYGVFGTVDNIAKRMGITDHNKVFKLPESRIYAMLKIDFENMMYQKRYSEIMSKRK